MEEEAVIATERYQGSVIVTFADGTSALLQAGWLRRLAEKEQAFVEDREDFVEIELST